MFLFLAALVGVSWAAGTHYRNWRYWVLWAVVFIISCLAISSDPSRLGRANAGTFGVASGGSIIGFAISFFQRVRPANRKYFWIGGAALITLYAAYNDQRLLHDLIQLLLIVLTFGFVYNRLRRLKLKGGK